MLNRNFRHEADLVRGEGDGRSRAVGESFDLAFPIPRESPVTQFQDRLRRAAASAWAKLERRAYAWGVRPGGALRLPDFLGIGGQKTGTTWLHANLSCHPDLFLTAQKELHYFDWYYHTRLRDYARHFADAGDLVAGEITPSYQLLPPRRIRMIKSLCPALRMILLVRNPMDRAWSQARMGLAKNRGRRIDEIPDDEFVAFFRSRASHRRGLYTESIDRWSSIFGADRLLVLFHDDIRNNPESLLTRIFVHLGVSSDVDWSRFPTRDVIFQGIEAPLPERFRPVLSELYGAEIDALGRRYPAAVAAWQAREHGTFAPAG